MEEESFVTLYDVTRITWWDGTNELPATLQGTVSATQLVNYVSAQWFDDDTPRPVMTATLTATPTNPVLAGAVVTLTSGPVGGNAPYGFTLTAAAGAPAPVNIGTGRWTVSIPANTPSGTDFGYSVSVVDSSRPQLSASAAYSIGVGITPPKPPPLTTVLAQKPPNPVARGTVVTLTATPTGGTPPYTYFFPAPPGAPVMTGTGNVRTLTIPATALDGTSYPYTVTVTDQSNPVQTASAPHAVRVSAPVVVRHFPGKETQVRMGMRSSIATWDARFAEVQGRVTVGGVLKNRVTAKRVYAFTDNTRTEGIQAADVQQIESALTDGCMPSVSLKDQSAGGGAPTSAELSAVAKLGDYLRGLGVDVAASFWHEPHNNFSGDAGAALFVAKQKAYMPLLKGDNISRGPILDGWLLQNQQARFGQFCPDELFDAAYWEWFGWDCYGSAAVLGDDSRPWASDHLTQARDYLLKRGYGDWNGFVGEWNGWTAAQIDEFCEVALTLQNSNSENFMWCVCLWNQTGGKGAVLADNPTYGPRLTDYKNYLNDPRVWSPAQGDA